MPPTVPRTTVSDLIASHDTLLFDSYGVLITLHGIIPGAPGLIRHLNRIGKPYFILTNDASRSARRSAERFQERGIDIPEERILTAGLAVGRYVREKSLGGARCAVLGTKDSKGYARDAGLEVSPPGEDADVLLVADEGGFPLREGLDAALNLVLRRVEGGRGIHLVLANPDLIYPAGENAFGITAGALGLLLEAAFARRLPGSDLRFTPLGKPHPPLFEEALARTGTRNMVMIGDQLETDVRGAVSFGLPAALVSSGLARVDAEPAGEDRPTWILDSLAVE